MKKLFALLLVVSLSLGLVACAKGDTAATGYGITHKIYVGVVTLTVDKDGKVLSGTADEYYLPFNTAVVEVTDTANVPTDVIIGNSHGVKYFAKYFSVNGTLFVASDNETGLPVYLANGVSLIAWVAEDVNAKAYVDGIIAGTVFIADENGAKSTKYATPAADKWTKSTTNYGGTDWNWAEQVAQFTTSLVGTTMDGNFGLGADKIWVVNDVKTGASMVDFAQYYFVAQRAYIKATK
ncbi:MAG: hypothetical protein WCI62_05145 [Erysipelotrichaceae bacterium]